MNNPHHHNADNDAVAINITNDTESTVASRTTEQSLSRPPTDTSALGNKQQNANEDPSSFDPTLLIPIAPDQLPPTSGAFSSSPRYPTNPIPALSPESRGEIPAEPHEPLFQYGQQSANATDDVYKWQEKGARQRIERSQTYHVPMTAEPNISNMKSPGGFRRHFVEQHTEMQGERPQVHHAQSFAHFLEGINTDYANFAGENFDISHRRSIVVPKDLEKRRTSLAQSNYSSLRLYTPGQVLQEDEIVIEEPQETISFAGAVGMLFKSYVKPLEPSIGICSSNMCLLYS
ncbi:hypothetical protein BGX27_008151 [Mortierella sp. AM989]|nr:hypothetical protein BGX27_008151 [Mortierella sp. AM989]